ncbi:DUF4271 domain-containing protein [Oscillatoria amoena NRMC-F 0135]|nr:DUF4271 domain-containing protein [Oscillatoria amoena NRMC-F 0135]
MAIFVMLHQHLKHLRILFLLLIFFPTFSSGQDTLRLPEGYKPYYDWESLPDSLVLEYQALYPERWSKDSLYYVLDNQRFLDSVMGDSMLKDRMFFGRFDTTVVLQTYSNYPPADAGVLMKKPIPQWIFWIVLLVLLGLVFLKYANLRLFNLLFLSFASPKYCDEALREHDTPVNIYNLAATLICALIYALFIWFTVIKTGWLNIHNNPTVSFLLVFVAISVFYLLRYTFIMFAAAILEAEYTYGVLVQVTVSGNMWLAIILMPLMGLLNAAFIHFNSNSPQLYVAAMLLIFLILKQVRVIIQAAPSFPHSIIYLILYLCALEIAPYLAIFKVVLKQTGL